MCKKFTIIFSILLLMAEGCTFNPQNHGASALEIPKAETPLNEKILEYKAFTISYNQQTLIPNWVAYQLTAEHSRGSQRRRDGFAPDPNLTGPQASDYDYRGSGYDRGHMVPAGDMKWDAQAMTETFYLTNVCPQDHQLNAGDWNNLEILCRMMARKYNTVYVVSGPVIKKGGKSIGRNKVAVPDYFFKTFLVKRDNGWSAIGFILPNKPGNGRLSSYARTIDEVEKFTGLDLYSDLEDRAEKAAEAKFYLEDWNNLKVPHYN